MKIWEFHYLGDKETHKLRVYDNECAFCKAAFLTSDFACIGDTVYICAGSDESHVHSVQCVGFTADGNELLACRGTTARMARDAILKYAVS